jgi:hypothetical protein
MNRGKKATRFPNIDALVKGGGNVTIGHIGPVAARREARCRVFLARVR